MLAFPNGKTVTFLCAAGALGLDGCDAGNGVIKLWKTPFRWCGLHKPGAWGLITKTLTHRPRRGRLRWWCPWRCVRRCGGGGWVNSVALTNPGYQTWIDRYYRRAVATCDVVIPSLSFDENAVTFGGGQRPGSIARCAWEMIAAFNGLDDITALEINLSCPNADHCDFEQMCWLVRGLCRQSRHPLIVKLGHDPDLIQRAVGVLDGSVFAFDGINAVKFTEAFPNRRSPLARYGLVGGVSGPAIKHFARDALRQLAGSVRYSKIISGGGIDSYQELCLRHALGADAFTLGVAFLRPWLPLRLKCQYEAHKFG